MAYGHAERNLALLRQLEAETRRPGSVVARVELGDRTLLQLSGQVAIDADRKIVGGNDMAAQADFIMDNITAILAAHGASLADVVNIRRGSG